MFLCRLALTSLLIPAVSGCFIDLEKEAATAVVQSALESTKNQSTARQVAEVASDDCSTITADQLAQEAADAPVVGIYPAGCLTKTASGPNVHAEYEHCTGIFGYADIDGGIDGTLELTGPCQLRADLTDSGDFTNNGRRYAYDCSADVLVRPGEREVTWDDHWRGTTVFDQTVEQTGTGRFLYSLATGCYDFEGDAEGSVDGTRYDFTVDDLAICEDECPSRGVVVAHWDRDQADLEIEVRFDGSDVAQVTGWSGREFEVDMVCDPAAGTAAD